MTNITANLVAAMLATIKASDVASGSGHPAAKRTCEIVPKLDLSGPDKLPPISGFAEAGRLDEPLALIRSDARADIRALAAAFDLARPYLPWIVDNMNFYPPGSDLGAGYLTTNMTCQVIGPENALAHAPDFRMGFFRFGAQVLYRDHAHLAPELYIPLTGPTQWRQDCGDWKNYESGSLIFNAPYQAHAMMTGDVPFLALFSWLEDVHEKIEIVPMDDWAAIEAGLKTADLAIQPE